MGQRGGKRAGAGRKKGAVSKRTREIAERAARDGKLLPLQYMLDVLRDTKAQRKRRDWAAEKAAPYIHPRLATHEVTGKGGGAIGVEVKSTVQVYLPNNGRRVSA